MTDNAHISAYPLTVLPPRKHKELRTGIVGILNYPIPGTPILHSRILKIQFCCILVGASVEASREAA